MFLKLEQWDQHLQILKSLRNCESYHIKIKIESTQGQKFHFHFYYIDFELQDLETSLLLTKTNTIILNRRKMDIGQLFQIAHLTTQSIL